MQPTYLIADTIIFDSKPSAVPYKYRLSYRMAQLLLVIHYSARRGGCSLVKLNLLSTALFSEAGMQEISSFSDNPTLVLCPIIRFDPAVNRAILYALAEGLIIQQNNGKLKLSDSGKKYIKLILEDETLFIKEKEILSKAGVKITEQSIKDIMTQWRYEDVSN